MTSEKQENRNTFHTKTAFQEPPPSVFPALTFAGRPRGIQNLDPPGAGKIEEIASWRSWGALG